MGKAGRQRNLLRGRRSPPAGGRWANQNRLSCNTEPLMFVRKSSEYYRVSLSLVRLGSCRKDISWAALQNGTSCATASKELGIHSAERQTNLGETYLWTWRRGEFGWVLNTDRQGTLFFFVLQPQRAVILWREVTKCKNVRRWVKLIIFCKFPVEPTTIQVHLFTNQLIFMILDPSLSVSVIPFLEALWQMTNFFSIVKRKRPQHKVFFNLSVWS